MVRVVDALPELRPSCWPFFTRYVGVFVVGVGVLEPFDIVDGRRVSSLLSETQVIAKRTQWC